MDTSEALQYMGRLLLDNAQMMGQLEAENARLRKALEAIVECGDGPCNNVFHKTNIQVARAALGKE
jgi:hypothetical protein